MDGSGGEGAPCRDVAERHGLQEPLPAVELHLAPNSRNGHADIVPGNNRDCLVLLDCHESFVHKEVEYEDRDHHNGSNDFGLIKSSPTFLEATANVVFVLAWNQLPHGMSKILGHFDFVVKINIKVSKSL